jgi:hypothetical protein
VNNRVGSWQYKEPETRYAYIGPHAGAQIIPAWARSECGLCPYQCFSVVSRKAKKKKMIRGVGRYVRDQSWWPCRKEGRSFRELLVQGPMDDVGTACTHTDQARGWMRRAATATVVIPAGSSAAGDRSRAADEVVDSRSCVQRAWGGR